MILPLHRRVRRLNHDDSMLTRCSCPRLLFMIKFRAILVALCCILLSAWIWLFLKVILHSIDHQDWYYNDRLEPSNSNWTIFYHIYVPAKSHKNALRIVREQLGQIKQAMQQRSTASTTFLYYTTIGDLLPGIKAAKFDACQGTPNLECRHVQHLAEGSEAVTLQTIYNFCQSTHPNHIVTYLHSKGSFHQHQVNERWRKHLTNAAVHKDCRDAVRNQQCNVCGLHFYTQWTKFFPGNMWTAQCGYIQQLWPPKDFAEHQEEAIAHLLWLRHRGVLTSRLFEDRLDRFGLERYSTEHWIGSHPNIKPCDMAPSPLHDWLKGIATEAHYAWALGPRQVDPPADNPPATVLELLQSNHSARRSELFYLPGRLRLWHLLYQTTPEPDSWIWSWFPDGSYWKGHLDETSLFGSKSEDSIFEAPTPLFPSVSLKPADVEAASISIFTTIDSDTAEREVQLLQINSLLAKGSSIQLFYQDLETIRNVSPNGMAIFDFSVRAQPLPHGLYEGGSLQDLYEYCQLDASSPNDLVLHVPKFDAQVVSKLLKCGLDTIQSGKCNICGGRLFSGSVLHFQEKNWIAKCSYIQNLLPPNDHVTAMNHAASKVWVEALKDRFAHVPASAECLGTDASALLSWATSHPDIVPCRLPDVPAIPSACLSPKDDEQKNNSNNKNMTDVRAFSSLAGHLWRWNFLYQQVPNSSSWVWTSFPDGQMWRNAVKRHGREAVVEMMTRKFADTSV